MGKKRITAFYMEMLVLMLVFIGVILLLTHIFALSKAQSGQARVLTRAVTLAENAAELAAASTSRDDLLERLNQADNAALLPDGWLRAQYSRTMAPAITGDYWVEVDWQPGPLHQVEIRVYWQGEEQPVYTLSTAVYREGGAP